LEEQDADEGEMVISARPSKQPLKVRTFLKVYMELGSYFLFLQEQIKDIIIITHFLPDDGRNLSCGARGSRESDHQGDPGEEATKHVPA
jgi:hypothetical protein